MADEIVRLIHPEHSGEVHLRLPMDLGLCGETLKALAALGYELATLDLEAKR